MSDLEKKFLIRSSGQILGPFYKEEVIELIKRGAISSFDEVAEPYTIWWYLEDHQEFKKAIRSMDFQTRLTNFLTQISNKFSTVSQTAKTGEKTKTETETLDQQDAEVQKIANLKTAQEVDIEILDKPKIQTKDYAKYKAKKDSEEIIRKKVSSIIKTIWRLMIVFSLSVGAYIIYTEIIIPTQTSKKITDQLNTEGLKFYKAGDYKQALPYFETAYSQNSLQGKDMLLLGSLYLQRNKLQKASTILDEFSSRSLSKTGNWFLLNGLVSFFQGDFSQAEKSFNQALNEKQIEALLNLAILKWQMGDYSGSLAYLDGINKGGYERGITFYLKALNLFAQNQNENLIAYINNDLSLNDSSPLVREYHQEFYFMLASSYMKQGNLEESEKALKSLLNQDPFFYGEYKYSSFIAVKSLDWTYFYPHCKNLFESEPENSLFNALYGFCYLKIGNVKEGSKFFEQAISREPKNPLFLSLYAYLLMRKGEELQAQEILSEIDYNQEEQKQPLPYIIRARFFEQKEDWAKALTVWKELLSLDAKQLSGIAGVAIASYKLGDYPTAEVYKKRGLDEYPYYVRLLSY